MKSVISALVVCLVGFPQLAVADETSKREAAEELLGVMNVEKQMAEQFVLMRQMQKAQLEQMEKMYPSPQGASYSSGVMEKTMDMVTEALSWDSLKGEYATAYAETFTEDELRAVIEFCRTPVGRKWIEKAPELTKRLMGIAQKRSQDLMPKMLEMFKAEAERERVREEAAPSSGGSSKR